ncbi:MAG: VOC family protein [Oscillospiraceae bacterium]|jgi:lactoylglutathione lyase|nr:VOC family protein [Oscillospiraceae bacterium]
MRFQGYHHIGIQCADAEASLLFYTEGLGGELQHKFPLKGTDKWFYLIDLGGNAVVELIPRGTPEAEQNPRFAHIALRCADCKAEYEAALTAGADAHIPPQTLNLGGMPVINAFVLGPDKEQIEFFELL